MRRTRSCIWASLILATVSAASAYDPDSHQQITERSAEADVSSLNTTLVGQLGLERGILQEYRGTIQRRARTIQALLGDGAVAEDSPDIRVLNHFHNPIMASWNDAGLRVLGVQLGQSAVVFQQSIAQGMGGQWAWQNARAKYLVALTDASKGQRDRAFAGVFETLGHVLHLLQDMTVPAHVRNDQHLLYEGYESWVQKTREVTTRVPSLDTTSLAGYKPTVEFNGTGNNQAPVPIARLMDSDVYDGINEDVLAGKGLGLAEYTNGNFFSGDTICRDFSFPRCPQVPLVPREEDSGAGAKRFYYPKQGGGESIDHFVVEGTLLQTVISRGLLGAAPAYVLDDRVYQDYAAKLIPHAVGYSAGLLDYFFRGKLEVVTLPGTATEPERLRIINRSPDPLGATGIFTLYQDTAEGVRTEVAKSSELAEAIPKDNDANPYVLPLPSPLSDGPLTLVYRGPLGQEAEAVIGKVVRSGVSVERIFVNGNSDPREWMLQTAEGTYWLPTRAVAGLIYRPAAVRWGERDNQLVAWTWATPGNGPFEALLFELARPEGSPQVPTTGEEILGYPVADLRLVQRIPLFETLQGVDLNTWVDFTEHLTLTHYRLGYAIAEVCHLTDPDWWGLFHYTCSATYSGETLEPALTAQQTVTAQFHLSLTPEYYQATDRAFAWYVRAVRADPAGRLLALIEVRLRALPIAETSRQFPLLKVENGALVTTGSYESFSAVLEQPVFSMLAVVDLQTGQLLGKSSQDRVLVEKTQRNARCMQDGRGERTYVDGGYAGRRDPVVVNAPCRFSWWPSWSVVKTLAVPPLETGTRVDQMEGFWRQELAGLGLGAATPQNRPPVATYVDYGSLQALSLRLDQAITSYLGPAVPSNYYNRLWGFGPVPGHIAFQADAQEWRTHLYLGDPTKSMWLLDWDLAQSPTQVTVAYAETGAIVAETVSGNSSGALLTHPGQSTWLWVPWTGARLEYPGHNATAAYDYVSLTANNVFNFATGQVYLLTEGLPVDPHASSLPSGGSSWDAYHAVGE